MEVGAIQNYAEINLAGVKSIGMDDEVNDMLEKVNDLVDVENMFEANMVVVETAQDMLQTIVSMPS